MNFLETLEAHLAAIARRDATALMATLPAADPRFVLITSDGLLIRSVERFEQMHRDWLASETWTLETELVEVLEGTDLGVALLKLCYRDSPLDTPAIHPESYLTLVFARRADGWAMVMDQNTPIRS